ncbi:MAG: hypothetical protein QOE70_2850 [Chthoniobacter sp.]|jgi:natural product biosynthesis luciferase-like monooxygenase protein/amino acid adenylation domain-containing protein|nr:hypothetical protein [Chthoniobacter sp.]
MMDADAHAQEGIAIIGLAGRFPGARNTDEFWRNLVAGKESIERLSDEQLTSAGLEAPALRADPSYVPARGRIERPDWFDAAFFGINPREAEVMDPQQRVFLEEAWTALEDAGCDPARYPGAIGVFAGMSNNTYFANNVSHHPELIEAVGQLTAMMANEKDYLATRVAYKLNLRGPALNIYTACSTSLVAVCQACSALQTYQCDTALAGGVSITFPQERGYRWTEGGITSPDGHCRAFDINAAGTVFSSGVGVVVLKRLADALAEGDQIYAVIKGAALNNDGSSKVSFTAPSVDGHAGVVALAQALADFPAETISYLEAHGTGTPLGDPIEVAGLTQAFRATTEARNFCGLGSVKTNLGHLDAAAGVAGLIKTALALRHRWLPPSLHFTAPNPELQLEQSPFYVVTEGCSWRAGESPRRAGVSSLGVGGTNAHVVLEEAPPVSAPPAPADRPELLIISARSLRALEDATTRLGEFLRDHPEIPLRDVAFTLQRGRRHFAQRRFLVAANPATAARQLLQRDRRHVFTTLPDGTPPPPTTSSALASLGHRWLAGEAIDDDLPEIGARKVSLPTYPFERRRYWAEPAPVAASSPRMGNGAGPLPSLPAPPSQPLPSAVVASRAARIASQLRALLEEFSGSDLSKTSLSSSFFELGFDSLFLTQISLAIQKRFGVRVTFRQLLEDLATLQNLVDFLEQKLPADEPPAASLPPAPDETAASASPTMAGQIETQRQTGAPEVRASSAPVVTPVRTKGDDSKRFGPFKPIEKGTDGGLTPGQEAALSALVARYNRRTAQSKAYAQQHRAHFCDPRAAGNFRLAWKEMVYPIVCARSLGARLWDLDGNEYVDVTMGFGTNYLGHSPDYVTRAVEEQLQRGVEIGPQTPLAGEAAQMICELTGFDRAAFCNTGSEAVLAALRIARTVTGRDKIVYFSGDYHGIFDEVLGRAALVDGQPGATPIAPGIPAIANAMVLEFDAPESIETIRAHGPEIAAVLVEPVQARHPGVQAHAFLHELRKLTTQLGIALIFDELITGFRIAPGGAQEYFGIQADLGTYGKILGGGMPIGALAGKRQYMDALDGGLWQFGDDSFPEVGVTFFAGTFVRHPLAIAAAHAVLTRLKAAGPELQRAVNERTDRLVRRMNDFFSETGLPMRLQHFSALFYYDFHPDLTFAGLLFYCLRDRGVHIWEGRVGHLSVAHTDADVDFIVEAFRESIAELQAGGFLPASPGTPRAAAEAQPSPALAAPPEETTLVALEVQPPGPAAAGPPGAPARRPPRTGAMDFSVYFFGHYEAAYAPEKYDVIFAAAKFADTHGFKAIWIPERHFHPLGGFSPNPAVLAAALARETSRLQLRAGSVVLPLHHPVRVAEEWAVVDNLSGGRVGISIASGWHPNDFVFAPENFEPRRELCYEGWQTIRKLWRGEAVEFPTGGRNRLKITLHPLPKQAELPAWLTCIHKESFIKAGELGLGVLTQTLNHSHEELAEKVAAYREAYARHGHDPAKANVTFLLHTFVAAEAGRAREIARKPMCDYLRSYLDNSQKRLESKHGEAAVDPEDVEFLVNRAFDDYVQGKALIGSPESCAEVIAQLHALGADEVGCLLDFGIDPKLVLDHLRFLDELRRLAQAVPAPAPRQISVPQAEQGLWVVAQFGPDAIRAYTEFLTLDLRGPLDPARLRSALEALVQRHEALRTTIDAGGTSQTIHPSAELAFGQEDVSDLPPHERARRTRTIFQELEQVVPDVTRKNALQTLLLRIGADQHQLVLCFHHLLGNGPSYVLFLHELCAIYAGGTLEHPMQLSDFAAWRQARLASAQHREDERFWVDLFRDGGRPLELPVDLPRPAWNSFRGGRARRRIGAELTRRVRESGARRGGSLFMVLFAAWQVLLHRLSGQNDFTVGVPFESEARALPDGERLFANTTNVAPLRCLIDPAAPFTALLAETKTRVLDAREHQEYFFAQLAEALQLKPDPSRTLLFTATFNYESAQFSQRAGDVAVELITEDVPFRSAPDVTALELVANVAEKDGVLHVECDYRADLFDAGTVDRWLGHFETLLDAIAADPTAAVATLPLLSRGEREEIVDVWNRTESEYPREATLHGLIREQALGRPEAIAVAFEDDAITYAQLEARAEALSARLRALGIAPGMMVGVFLARSIEMIVAVLAVLKAGAAYVPMDPAYPAERLGFMIEDAAMPAIVTRRSLVESLPAHQARLVCLDEKGDAATDPGTPARAEDLAYVIFTSGSTGRPKGVQIPHRAAVNLVTSLRQEPGLTERDALLSVASLSFDMSVADVFWPLTTGAKLVIASPKAVSDGRDLAAEIARHGITAMQATPVTWQLLLEAGWAGSPDFTALVGGEACPRSLANELLARCGALWILYGPTETCVWSSVEKLTPGEDRMTIGRPIANTRIYIVDAALQPTPIGVPGELLIGGAGLARGYASRPDLTAEKFIPDPSLGGGSGRVYRTGDLARFLPGGRIECLGRIDRQVKVRGFRIELGEIETVLKQISGIADCRVIHQRSSANAGQLAAYLIPENGAIPSADTLRATLARKLPAHMIPGSFTALAAFPLTPSGKLDVAAFPQHEEGAATVAVVPPKNSTEAQIIEIWEELLTRRPIGSEDDFFALGGHSLLAIRLLNRVREKFGVEFPVRHLFETPTVAGMAAFIVSHRSWPHTTKPVHSLIPVQRGDARRRPFFLVPGGWGGEVELLVYGALTRHMGPELPLYCLRARGADASVPPHRSVEAMVADYVEEIRTFQPQGPYLLGGECVGGVIAYEMARRFEALGEKVDLLVLLDSERPERAAYRHFCKIQRAERWEAFWHARVQRPFREHLKKLSGLSWPGKFIYVWDRATRRRKTSSQAAPDLLDQRKLLAHYPRLLMSHKVGPCRGKLTLLIAEESFHQYGTLGWEKVETGGLDVHVMKGDHLTYIREHAASTAPKLRELIERADSLQADQLRR